MKNGRTPSRFLLPGADVISAIILAAGESSRMQSPKPLLKFGDDTALSIAIRNCLHNPIHEIIVVLGAHADKVGALHSPEVKFVINEQWKKGRTGSLQTGLRVLNAKSGAFLLYPVDHALTTAHDIHLLVNAFKESNGGKKIFIPIHGGKRGHPVLFDAALTQEFLMMRPDQPANEVPHTHADEVSEVNVDNPDIARDIDTRHDYDAAYTLFKKRLKQAKMSEKGKIITPKNTTRKLSKGTTRTSKTKRTGK